MRALCRDISPEQEFRPVEGSWCASCDFQEFCPAKAKSPRPVPAGGRARQLGFDFEEWRGLNETDLFLWLRMGGNGLTEGGVCESA